MNVSRMMEALSARKMVQSFVNELKMSLKIVKLKINQQRLYGKTLVRC